MRNYFVLGIILLIALAGGMYYFETLHQGSQDQVACTLEAKMCPDGSYVGRTGPNCEFAACPSATTTPEASSTAPIVGVGAHCGGFIRNAPVCSAGLHCQLNVSTSDTGGVCVAD